MKHGDRIEIRALKTDGTIYRWWRAAVESVCANSLVTINQPGDEVHGPAGGWAIKHTTRTYYWFNKPYNLAEVYHPDGQLKQIYIHIASPAKLAGGALIYTDHELDVVRKPGQALSVRDEDEFEAACSEYGYSHEFQCSCREAVKEALRLASGWHVAGVPRAPRPRSKRRSRLRAGYSRRCNQSKVRTDIPATDSSTRKTDV